MKLIPVWGKQLIIVIPGNYLLYNQNVSEKKNEKKKIFS